ncbi:MAG: glycosyltransferase family 4 protein [Cyanobacteria bacterium P01_A01_bin.37]
MAPTSILKQRLGYLSGAPRISTRHDAEISGPRAHILGCLQAKQTLGWDVKRFIVGDRLPKSLVTGKSETAMSGGFAKSLLLDAARIALGAKYARQAWHELQNQVDWVYERFAPFQALGMPFKRHGMPWVLETHAPLFYEAKTERKTTALTSLAQKMELQAYRNCDALVCVTDALKELIVEAANIPPQKVIVVPNGVDTEQFHPSYHAPERLFPDFTVGFVGRLYAWHGLDLLLEAIAELRAEGIYIAFVVVGDGLMRDEWEAKAQTLGIGDTVKFVGQVPWADVPSYIAGFDVGYTGQIQLQVGKMYHSPLKLYEYMAMAKPIVASAFEDAKRTIQDGETGFLFEPGHKEDLKRALRLAYQLRPQMNHMGEQARQTAIEHHSWIARMRDMTTKVEAILSHPSQSTEEQLFSGLNTLPFLNS